MQHPCKTFVSFAGLQYHGQSDFRRPDPTLGETGRHYAGMWHAQAFAKAISVSTLMRAKSHTLTTALLDSASKPLDVHVH